MTMSAQSLNESTLENLTLSWFTHLGYKVAHGQDIAPGEPGAERDSYDQVVLVGRCGMLSSD
jgi:type I restriction enzyme, R subunit